MILTSEIIHAEKRLDSYIDDVNKFNVLRILFGDFGMRKRYVTALNVLIVKGLIDPKSIYRKITFRAIMVLTMIYIRNYFLWFLTSGVVGYGISSLLSYLILKVNVTFAISFLPVLLLLCIIIVRNIFEVTNIMDERVIELGINFSIGSEAYKVLIASDIAYDIVTQYTDDAVYYSSENKENQKEYFQAIHNEIKLFLENRNLKILFDSGGRHFQLAGLISLMSSIYDSLIKYSDSDDSTQKFINDGISSYNVPNYELNLKLESLIDDWVDKSDYRIMEVMELSSENIVLLLLFCKDKLLRMNEQYTAYDRL